MGVASIKQEVNPENKKLLLCHLFNNLKDYIFIYLFIILLTLVLHEEVRNSREANEVVLSCGGGIPIWMGSSIQSNRQCKRVEEESASRVEWAKSVRGDLGQKDISKS